MASAEDEQLDANELLAEFKSWRKRWVRNAVIGYVILLVGVGVAVRNTNEVANKSSDVNCSLADLIAHVPAIPYDTETIDNFRGWVEARATLVNEAGIEESCAPEIVDALERSSAADEVLLRQLERKAANE